MLKVIEKLRAYKPRRSHIKSASQGFGSRSFGALNFFGTPSRSGTPTPSRRHSLQAGTPHSHPVAPSPLEHELNMMRNSPVTDDEDPDATLVMHKSKGKNKARSPAVNRSVERAESAPMPSLHDDSGSASPHFYPPRHLHKESEDADDTLDVKAAAKHVAKAVKTTVLHDARNLEGRTDSDLAGLVWDVSSAYEAKRLAKAIFYAFRNPTRSHLIASDFYPAFSAREEAETAFRVFDKDNNGDISRAEIKTALLKVYKERRFLSRSMRDVSVALSTLDNILLIFALIILFFISLSVFGVSVGNSLTSLYSLGIGLSFIFKNACSNAFDAIMFLFVTQYVLCSFHGIIACLTCAILVLSILAIGASSTVRFYYNA
jgi:hypothetical protein